MLKPKAKRNVPVMPMSPPPPVPPPAATESQPRARGAIRMTARRDGRRTVVSGLRQAGSLKVLFPRVLGPGLQAVLINTAGGVTGGDSFTLEATAEAGTELTLTTQAAERAYMARPGETAQIVTSLSVQENARLTWLPQETILFRGCALDRTLRVDLAGTAGLLLCETLVFGRGAMKETLSRAALCDTIDVRRDGVPLFLDRIRLSGDVNAHLARPHVAAGAGAMTSLLLVVGDAAARLDPLRALLPETGGASLIRDDLLFLRALAPDGFALRRALVPILEYLTANNLPRCWMI